MDDPAPESTRSRGWMVELVALVLAFLAVPVRCKLWGSVFTPDGVVLPGADPYYHLIRANNLVDGFPTLAAFDPFISFPDGAAVPWPPFFDALIALPGLFGGDVETLASWGAVLMPVLGGLAVYLTYRLGRCFLKAPAALVAAGFVSLMDGAIAVSHVGRIDHHALVAPVTLGIFLAFLACLRASTRARMIGWGIACGGLAAFSVGSWIVTPPLYFLPVPLSLVVLALKGRAERYRTAAWICLGSSVVLVTSVVLLTADLADKPLVLYQPSWFTVLLFVGMAAACLPFFYSSKVVLVSAGAGLALLVAAAIAWPELFAPLWQGLAVAGGGDPSYAFARESSNFFVRKGVFTLTRITAAYTHLVLLVPILWMMWSARAYRDPDLSPGSSLLVVFSLLATGLVFFQDRFGEFAAPALALLFGWALVEMVEMVSFFYRQPERQGRAMVYGALFIAATAAALSPVGLGLLADAQHGAMGQKHALMKFGHELKLYTPAVEPDRGGRLPEFGVLSGWDEAHALLRASGHAVMVSSFATPEALAANREAFGILLADEEERAYQALASHRIRYVVVSPMIPLIQAMADMAGQGTPLLGATSVQTNEGLTTSYQLRKGFLKTLYSRLWFGTGSDRLLAGVPMEPLSHFRLHLVSRGRASQFDQVRPSFQAFEVVAGARIRGRTEPGTQVRLELRLETDTAMRFAYRRLVTADTTGSFELVVPYPTRPWGAAVHPIGPYRLWVGDRKLEVELTEAEVVAGHVRVIGIEPPAPNETPPDPAGESNEWD